MKIDLLDILFLVPFKVPVVNIYKGMFIMWRRRREGIGGISTQNQIVLL